MSNLLFFAFATYGATTLIVQSKAAKPIREFFKDRVKLIYSLLTCMMCTGFWVSLATSFIMPISNNVFLDAAFGVGMIWFLHTIQLFFEKQSGEEL